MPEDEASALFGELLIGALRAVLSPKFNFVPKSTNLPQSEIAENIGFAVSLGA